MLYVSKENDLTQENRSITSHRILFQCCGALLEGSDVHATGEVSVPWGNFQKL